MPTVNDLKQSKFLTKADVIPPILVTIRGYELLNMALQGEQPEMKWCLKFDEHEKPMSLNSTNGQIIAKITGSEDFDGWIGKRIVLFDDPSISFGGKLTGGIRVRAPRIPNPAPVVAASAPAPAPVQPAFDPTAEPNDPSGVPF